jgi:hypothetical protein
MWCRLRKYFYKYQKLASAARCYQVLLHHPPALDELVLPLVVLVVASGGTKRTATRKMYAGIPSFTADSGKGWWFAKRSATISSCAELLMIDVRPRLLATGTS